MIMFERLSYHLSFPSLGIIVISITRVSLLQNIVINLFMMKMSCFADYITAECIFSNLNAFCAILCSWALSITRNTQSNALGRAAKVRQNANAGRHTLVHT